MKHGPNCIPPDEVGDRGMCSCDGQTWSCTVCDHENSAQVEHCERCEFSRMVMRNGQLVPRDMNW